MGLEMQVYHFANTILHNMKCMLSLVCIYISLLARSSSLIGPATSTVYDETYLNWQFLCFRRVLEYLERHAWKESATLFGTLKNQAKISELSATYCTVA